MPEPYSPWDNPNTYSYRNDPDGFMAERYHERNGEWPKGSRQRWEQDRRDERQRHEPIDRHAHPTSIREDTFRSALMSLNVQKLGLRISAEMLESVHVRYLAEEVAYMINAFVLQEKLPPERIAASTVAPTTTVHLGPATWRDFWKLTHGHRWWARWWVRRRPARVIEHPLHARHKVEYELTTDERQRLYPHADVKITDKLGRGYIHVPITLPMSLTWIEQLEEPRA